MPGTEQDSSTDETVERTTSNHPPFDITLLEDDMLFEHLNPAPSSSSRLMMYEKDIRSLPLPPALWDAFQRACSKGASSQQLGKIIKDDPVLAASVLRIANGPGLGVRVPINDVGRAIAHLGISMVRSIVSRHSFSGNFADSGKVYNIPKLWKHGMAVSALAEIIADFIPGCNREKAGTLGLFHDIGKMTLNLFTQYMQPAELDLNQGHLVYEQTRFGCTHIDMGALLAKHWELPENIVQGITYHHYPAYAEAKDVPADIRSEVLAVYLADLLAIRLGFGSGEAGIVMPHESYASLLPNTTLMDIMNSKKVADEMVRIGAIKF